MVSINTNLSSLIVQGNLANSTNGLNKAVERLSTGYKINHAGDNAANYSIANKYEAKLSSYDVAADNITMGMDLLSVAQDTISTMQNHGARLQALITQARNGTYGAQSLNAMTQEAGAIISEIHRMYTNTQYNNINLFDNSPLPEWAKNVKSTAGAGAGIEEGQIVGLTKDLTPKANGFIDDIVTVTPDIVVESADDLADAIADNSVIGIANAGVLKQLATLVNSGTNCSGKTITLTDDIDLSDYQAGAGWIGIGADSNEFAGTFDGQGHKITGLVINSSASVKALFTRITSEGVIKNLEVKDAVVNGKTRTAILAGICRGNIANCHVSGIVTGEDEVACLVGQTYGKITNCYSSGSVTATGNNVGGLAGWTSTTVSDSFSSASVSGTSAIGGLVGRAGGNISNSYATGKVTATSTYAGGLVGTINNNLTISNCYATGNVKGNGDVGGLAGYTNTNSKVKNCYATGNIKGIGQFTGGLIGFAYTDGEIKNSYASGNVVGAAYTGGLVGNCHNTVNNSYATGDVNGTGTYVGGLIGYCNNSVSTSFATGNVTNTSSSTGGLIGNSTKTITNCYATGMVTGEGESTGGLAGYTNGAVTNCYSTSSVTGKASSGGLVGQMYTSGSISDSYSIGTVCGTTYTGGLVGMADGAVNRSYSTGDVKGTNWVGGLVGRLFKTSGTLNLDKLFSSGKVTGTAKLGSLIGGINNTPYGGASFSTINITNAKVLKSELKVIGFEGAYEGTGYQSGQMAGWLENIKQVEEPSTNLQVGINGDESSQITFKTWFEYDLSSILTDISSDKAYSTITKFMSTLSEKATDLGAASNRLESALDSVLVNMENLTSSLSTVKDVDMAQESSQYIRMQILQQASATLLATANQSPSIALQLI